MLGKLACKVSHLAQVFIQRMLKPLIMFILPDMREILATGFIIHTAYANTLTVSESERVNFIVSPALIFREVPQ